MADRMWVTSFMADPGGEREAVCRSITAGATCRYRLFASWCDLLGSRPGRGRRQPQGGSPDPLRTRDTPARVAGQHLGRHVAEPSALRDSEASEQRLDKLAETGQLGRYRYQEHVTPVRG